jgi:hypothetical protein
MMSPALSKSAGKRNVSQVAAAPGAAPEMEPITEPWELDQLIDLWPTLPLHVKRSILLLARAAALGGLSQ